MKVLLNKSSQIAHHKQFLFLSKIILELLHCRSVQIEFACWKGFNKIKHLTDTCVSGIFRNDMNVANQDLCKLTVSSYND